MHMTILFIITLLLVLAVAQHLYTAQRAEAKLPVRIDETRRTQRKR